MKLLHVRFFTPSLSLYAPERKERERDRRGAWMDCDPALRLLLSETQELMNQIRIQRVSIFAECYAEAPTHTL